MQKKMFSDADGSWPTDEINADKKLPREYAPVRFDKLRLWAAIIPLIWCFITLGLGVADDMGGPAPVSIWIKGLMTVTCFISLWLLVKAVPGYWHLLVIWVWPLSLGLLMLMWART